MENFLKFLADPTVQIIGWTLGGIGWILGIISGWLQIKGYRQQNKMEQGYIAILEQAKRDWEGKYTEEQIESMTKELKRLEESINKDVPQKARRVFLEDQLSTLTESMAQEYKRYNEMSKELKSHNEQLPDQVQNAIEQEIMPKYLEQQMQQRTTLAILGAFGAILLFYLEEIFSFRSLTMINVLGVLCLFIVINYSIDKHINALVNKIGKKTALYIGLVVITIMIVDWFLILTRSNGFTVWESIFFLTGNDRFATEIIRWLLSAFAIMLISRSRKQ